MRQHRKKPSPGEKVALKGSEEECGRKTESLYNLSGLLTGCESHIRESLQVSRFDRVSPAFLFSHRLMAATASPRGKRLGCSRTSRKTAPSKDRAVISTYVSTNEPKDSLRTTDLAVQQLDKLEFG